METGVAASALGSTGGLGTQISITLFFPTLREQQELVKVRAGTAPQDFRLICCLLFKLNFFKVKYSIWLVLFLKLSEFNEKELRVCLFPTELNPDLVVGIWSERRMFNRMLPRFVSARINSCKQNVRY